MKLLTKKILKGLPGLYDTKGEKEAVIRVKFFLPETSWSWYGIEYDPKSRLFFGIVENKDEKEYGYFSLEELEGLRSPRLRLPVERDLYFENIKAKDFMKREVK